MRFDLSEEQYMLRDSIEAAFSEYNTNGKIQSRYDSPIRFDKSAWIRQIDMGLAGVMVSIERGGSNLDILTLSNVSEMNGYYAISTPLEYQALAAWALALSGNVDLIDRWLDSIISGDIKATIALTEPTGSCPEDWSIDDVSLNGEKMFVPFAGDADVILVGVRGGGISLVVLGDEQVEISPIETLDRSRPLFTVTFREARGNPLGENIGSRLYDALLIVLAADAFGAAKQCLEMATDYVKTREQFGRSIAEFQAVKHQLAKCALDLEPSRFLYWHAAYCWDTSSLDASRHASLAKLHIANVAVKTARLAVELHGGIGFTWEYPLQIWLKRAMADQGFYGGAATQATRVSESSGW